MRFCLHLVWCLLGCCLAAKAGAQDVAHAPLGEKSAEKLRTKVYWVPPSVVSTADPADPNGVRTYPPGVENLSAPDEEARYDIRPLLRTAGINLSADAEVFYFPNHTAVVVRAGEHELTDCDALFNFCGLGGFSGRMRVNLTLAECEIGDEGAAAASLGYRELRQKAGVSWHEVESLTVPCRSAGSATSAHVVVAPGADHLPKAPTGIRQNGEMVPLDPLLPSETGIRARVECLVGADERYCDVNCSIRWRVRAGESSGEFDSSVNLWENYPAVLQMTIVPADPAQKSQTRKLRVLVLTVNAVNLGDWPQKK